MMSRGRHSQSQGWDSMREDNDTTYDAQYPDDEVKSGGVQLDHCKLYITNVNQALNEEGLRAAFMPYGTIAKVYLSNDPSKKYALVTYETPGEAKMAMMKLNRTEPLKLNIHFAHKSKARERRYNNNRQESGSYRNDNRQESGSYRNDISRQESDNYRSDNISLSSHGRLSINQDDYTNGGFNDMGIDEDDEDMDFDPELDLERKKMIEQLELDRLKLCEEQVKCQQRMIYLEKKAGKKPTVQNPIKNAPAVPNPIKRCILPDGRVVIRNDSNSFMGTHYNRNADHQPDNAFNSAAGDSRVGARHCLRCGKPADAYCAQCGVAPYCGQRCQEIDWVQRHRNVCHNLARTSQGTAEVSKEVKPVEQVGMPDFPAPAPLRRPRSPAPSVNKRDFKDDNNDRAKKTFTPPAQMKNNANLNVRDGGNSRGGNSRGGKSRGGGQSRGGTNQADRRPRQNDSNVDEEDDTWDLKDNTPSRATEAVTAVPAQKPFVPKPTSEPVPQKSYQPTKKETEVPKVETVQQRLYQSAKKEPEVPKVETVAQRYQPEKKEPEVPKVEPAAEVSYKPPVSVADTAPKMKTVPVKYLIETLSIGDVCVLTIDAQASECRSNASGYVCLSLHEAKQLDFALLCEEDFTNDCEAAADYKPNPGDLFSYRNPEDGLFYRARRLDATSVALIDSSRVVTISAADVCKKIPAKYEDIVEFCCLLDAANVKVCYIHYIVVCSH
ncbi:uncharacterized protein LOC112056126 isoform X5 [Bicyclus anynana]|uniref:Uncharacterized protein LOC112056126 isoform X5 n=1 Tax=Bicyclus anynana TaxID=110368 RepID=A0ABM3M417_BICAN|nr:uncharacterized protein LOC112056126 isoform X5 [Bicyclus anynana]